MTRDSELLDFLDTHKEYVLGFAPSGNWCSFHVEGKGTCYGKTVRECLEQLQVMHNDLNSK